MANSKKRRKVLIFCAIGLVLAGLAAVAIFKKREPVITVQTEKVARRNLTELVIANGKIQPVLQVKISPEVSGEIIDLPVKEGDFVHKGDLILKIKPDFYIANRNQAQASYQSSLASQVSAAANLERARAEFERNKELFDRSLISSSIYLDFETSFEVAGAQLTNSMHQVEMAKALLARAEEELAKTTMVSPLTGTISRLNSRLGERVVGTATMAGTEVMTIADLNEMEARVDIGEIDIVLIKPGQHVRLEVDSFKDRKFNGLVTQIANSANASGLGGGSQDATKFEVKVRIQEKEPFLPGMSVTAEIETRYRTNVLTVPIATVTTRLPKDTSKDKPAATNSATLTAAAKTNSAATNTLAADPPAASASTNTAAADKKPKEIEVVFRADGDRAKMVPVKIGICDDTYWEITDGLKEGEEIVSGGFRAISRDLEDGKKIRRGPPPTRKETEEEARDQGSK